MTHQKIDPDSSSEILLDTMKRSISLGEMKAVTAEEVEAHQKAMEEGGPESVMSSIPPSASMREKQIAAWNSMSENLVKVVQTIKKNEKRQAEAEKRTTARATRLAGAVYLALIVGSLFIGMVGWMIKSQVDAGKAAVVDMQVDLRARLEESSLQRSDMKRQQDATLTAVNALAVALGRKLEAEASQDPAAEKEAVEAAQIAQVKALEAKKASADTPQEKAETDKKIEEVKSRPSPRRPKRPKNDPLE